MIEAIDRYGRTLQIDDTAEAIFVTLGGERRVFPPNTTIEYVVYSMEGSKPADWVPPEPSLTDREKRALAYHEELAVVPTDDRITVIGDTLDKLIAQIASMTTPGQRTPEFAELLAKVAAIKTRIPKKA